MKQKNDYFQMMEQQITLSAQAAKLLSEMAQQSMAFQDP